MGDGGMSRGYVVWLDACRPADAADRWPLQPRVGCIHTPLVIQMDGRDDLFGYKKGQGEPGLLGS